MKNVFKINNKQNFFRSLIVLTGVLLLLQVPSASFAQADTVQQPITDTTAVPAEEPATAEEEP